MRWRWLINGEVSPRTTRLPMGTDPRRTTRRPIPVLRIVVRGFEIVDVLRHLLGIDVPVAGLIHVVQIGVEDGDGFEVEDIVHQLGELRSGARCKDSSSGCAALNS